MVRYLQSSLFAYIWLLASGSILGSSPYSGGIALVTRAIDSESDKSSSNGDTQGSPPKTSNPTPRAQKGHEGTSRNPSRATDTPLGHPKTRLKGWIGSGSPASSRAATWSTAANVEDVILIHESGSSPIKLNRMPMDAPGDLWEPLRLEKEKRKFLEELEMMEKAPKETEEQRQKEERERKEAVDRILSRSGSAYRTGRLSLTEERVKELQEAFERARLVAKQGTSSEESSRHVLTMSSSARPPSLKSWVPRQDFSFKLKTKDSDEISQSGGGPAHDLRPDKWRPATIIEQEADHASARSPRGAGTESQRRRRASALSHSRGTSSDRESHHAREEYLARVGPESRRSRPEHSSESTDVVKVGSQSHGRAGALWQKLKLCFGGKNPRGDPSCDANWPLPGLPEPTRSRPLGKRAVQVEPSRGQYSQPAPISRRRRSASVRADTSPATRRKVRQQ